MLRRASLSGKTEVNSFFKISTDIKVCRPRYFWPCSEGDLEEHKGPLELVRNLREKGL